MPHTFRKFAPCGARVSKDGGGRGVRAASCFETHRSAVVLAESHMQASAAMLLSVRPN